MPRGPCRTAPSDIFNVPPWGQGSLASPTPLLACEDRGSVAESPVHQSIGWDAPTQHVPSVHTAVLDPCDEGKLRGLWPRTDHYCTKNECHPSPLINELLDKPEADTRLKTFDLPYPSLHHTVSCLQTPEHPICLHELNKRHSMSMHVAFTLERDLFLVSKLNILLM